VKYCFLDGTHARAQTTDIAKTTRRERRW